jgi:beta-phosphoglucomutase-like phosphatase (HAD superfamily)
MMNKLAIAFDIDGVIVDSEPLHFQALCEVVRITDRCSESLVGLSLKQTLLACGIPEEAHAAYEKEITAFYLTHLCSDHLRPEVSALLAKLIERNIRFGFVSTASRAICLGNLALALGERVASIPLISGECVPVTKPHPAPYCALARLLKTPPTQMIAIEDTDIGICSAMSAGIEKIYAWPNQCSSTQTYRYADQVISQLSHIPELDFVQVSP